MPSRGRANPRRGIIVRTRRGWGPGASEREMDVMKRHAFAVGLVAIALLLVGSRVSGQGKLNLVATTEDLAAIAREVGGDRIAVDFIARGYQDPHFVEAKPSFILKLQRADVLVVVGRELEAGWL